MAKILVLFHSVTGATYRLAEAIKEGVEEVDGCSGHLRRVADIPGSDIIFGGKDMSAAKASFADVPEAVVSDLYDYDGLAIGTPVYFGSQSSSLRYFFDQSGKYWMEGSLTGKPVTAFAGGGSGAGREAALLSLWSTFAGFGMTIVSLGTRAQAVTPKDQPAGTSSFGAATLSGADGDRPSEAEKAAARIQGRALAETTLKLITN